MISDLLKWLLMFIFSLILQTSFVPIITLWGIKPDLPLIVLFFFSLKFEVLPAMLVGFFLGLGQDIYSPSMLGQNAFATMVCGAFVGLFNERVMKTDPIIKAVLLFLTIIIHDTLFWLIQIIRLADSFSLLFYNLFRYTFLRCVYSILFASLVFLWDIYIKPKTRW
jgi:rod shape-determining protein MreD